jgi:hypothetical protein
MTLADDLSIVASGDGGEHLFPINGDLGHRGDLCLSFEFEKGYGPIVTSFKPVDRHCAIDGMYEPDFANAGALVSGDFPEPVVSGGTR